VEACDFGVLILLRKANSANRSKTVNPKIFTSSYTYICIFKIRRGEKNKKIQVYAAAVDIKIDRLCSKT